MAELQETPGSGFARLHEAWHRNVEARRIAPHGPLSPVAMHWLSAEPLAYERAPGIWSVDAEGAVSATFSAEENVSRDGVPLVGAISFEPLTGVEGFTLDWGEKLLEVAARSGNVVLRPRDPASPDRLDYRGTQTFKPEERMAILARFVPTVREAVEIESAAGIGRMQYHDSPGTAHFEADGQSLALTLFGSAEGNDLRVVFADATGKDLTYPAARFLDVQQIDETTVLLDFNRSTNPPCAYNVHATCPYPPPENRLAVRIEAGELRPGTARPE